MHQRSIVLRPWALALTAITALTLITALACGGGANPPAAQPAGGGTAAAPSANEPVPPMSSRGTPVTDGGGAASAAAGSITWDLPPGWQEEQPSSGMRLAQALIPGAGGPGLLVVFHFGPGGGGGVEANLTRWVEQMDVKPGTSPQRSTLEVGSYKVTTLDVAGTLKPSGMGSGPTTPQPDSEMLAAVVEGPGGPWFFKATGPEATMTAARDAFRAMLESVRPAG